jgi:hypothetical protein
MCFDALYLKIHLDRFILQTIQWSGLQKYFVIIKNQTQTIDKLHPTALQVTNKMATVR